MWLGGGGPAVPSNWSETRQTRSLWQAMEGVPTAMLCWPTKGWRTRLIYRLQKEQREELLAQPEHGMGYQLACEGNVIFLNAEIAVSAENAEPEVIDEHLPWLKRFAQEADDDARTELLCSLDRYAASLDVRSHGSYSSATRPNEVFFRYSAFRRDRRVDPASGAVLPGTYATTQCDSSLVPSGLAAVGRYALPFPLPALYAYQLNPPPTTQVRCGNSAPAFGQAGGGVEILFNAGCPAATASLPPSTIPDR